MTILSVYSYVLKENFVEFRFQEIEGAGGPASTLHATQIIICTYLEKDIQFSHGFY